MIKKGIRFAATIMTCITACILMTTQVHAAQGWNQNSTGWWWEEADGSYPVNAWKQVGGTWYYFNGSGYMVTGWQKIGGTWYYMDASGAMVTGWQKIGNTWYYFDGSGAMVSDTWVDGYYLDGSGAWVEGNAASGTWVQSGNRWWYKNADGTYPANEWKEISSKWYYFDKDGWMVTGWQKLGSTWYYMDASGAMMTNAYIGGYYVGADGAMTTPPHVHSWKEVTETVTVPEQGHWEKVEIAPEYSYDKYEEHILCAHCDYDFNVNNNGTDINNDITSHICPDGTTSASYGNRSVKVGIVTVPPLYEDQWVVDVPASTETKVTGYTCECGETKDAE